MFGNLGNMASLLKQMPEMMKQAREMQGRMGEVQEELARLRAEGEAGGGMVKAVATGQQKIVSLKIEPELLTSGDAEMLEDLVMGATNQALEKSREAAQQHMLKAQQEMMQGAGDVDLGDLGDTLAKMGLTPPPKP